MVDRTKTITSSLDHTGQSTPHYKSIQEVIKFTQQTCFQSQTSIFPIKTHIYNNISWPYFKCILSNITWLSWLFDLKARNTFLPSTKNTYFIHSKTLALNPPCWVSAQLKQHDTFHNHNSFISFLVWCGRELADYVYNLVWLEMTTVSQIFISSCIRSNARVITPYGMT
jgi:hypothetical protein